MSDTETAVAEVQETQPKIAGIGKVKRTEMTIPTMPESEFEQKVITKEEVKEGTEVKAENVENKEEPKVEAKVEEIKAEVVDTKTQLTPTEISDEQRKQVLKDLFGDSEIDIEAIKQSLKKPEDKIEEQKQESYKELASRKLFVDNGGTTAQYDEIKRVAFADLKELSKTNILSDLMNNNGLSQAEAELFISKTYLQDINVDELEQDYDNETDEQFEKRKEGLEKMKELGTKQLELYSLNIQKQAVNSLDRIAQFVEQQELQAKEEATISANVDDMLKNYARKQTIELGKANDLEIAPIEHEYSESSFKQVADILKDPAKRNNIFNKEDGTLDLTKAAELLLSHFEYKRSVKNAYLEAQDRAAKIVNSTFPHNTPFELGIGGSPTKSNGKGVIVGVGKPQRSRPQYN